MNHFNNLTPAEHERLSLLVEECSEVIQAAGKILRHGYESKDPTDDNAPTNRSNLERELGDVSLILRIMVREGDVNSTNMSKFSDKKAAKLQRYLHHNEVNKLDRRIK